MAQQYRTATVAISALTALAWLVASFVVREDSAALALGFIPARLSGADVPWTAAPAILTPLTATLVHSGLIHLAFNLLMGTEWPAGENEFARAESVLRELGLGPTLDRMPSGLLQTVGETGWQLSHGERSRVYLARALLQQPDVLILDESFAQLDSENMHLALDAVAARHSAVLLIAHT